jgi:xanthine dehydrogenase accessory factor
MSSPVSAPERGAHSGKAGGEWLRPIVGDWPSVVCRELEVAPAVVRVVVAEARGSSPREPGTCMLIGAHGIVGTIGGGHLEWQAIQFARDLLGNSSPAVAAGTQRLVLGAQLAQCCGGVVELWIERFTRRDLPLLRSAAQAVRDGEPVLMATALGPGGVTRRVMGAATPAFLPPQLRSSADALLAVDAKECIQFARLKHEGAEDDDVLLLERLNPQLKPLWIYGAGHVAQAVVRVLSGLPIAITLIDARAELLPRGLPVNVRAIHTSSLVVEASMAPRAARHLVMTHDHALDYELCRSILLRDQFEWLGLIGSASKGARFRSRLRRDGVTADAIERLICPIGVDGIDGKAPAIIAISVAAQILQTLSEATEATSLREVALSPRRQLLRPDFSDSVAPHAAGECPTDHCASCGPNRRAQL